ncbi:methyltransferase [Methanobacterium movens]
MKDFFKISYIDKMMKYKGLKIESCDRVYTPSEDTLLLADNLKSEKNDYVLEIGTGTGFIALTASLIAKKVVATDINPHAVKCAWKNLKINNISNMEVRQGDLFKPVEGEKFDLIIFNTPYLPSSEDEIIEDDLDAAWNGGIDGRKVIDVFLDDLKDYLCKKGRVQLVQSSLSDNKKTLKKLEKMGFNAEITAMERFFFEEIVVISAELK